MVLKFTGYLVDAVIGQVEANNTTQHLEQTLFQRVLFAIVIGLEPFVFNIIIKGEMIQVSYLLNQDKKLLF